MNTKQEEGKLTLQEMSKLYKKIGRQTCDYCKKKVRYIYFIDGQLLAVTCIDHAIEKKDNL